MTDPKPLSVCPCCGQGGSKASEPHTCLAKPKPLSALVEECRESMSLWLAVCKGADLGSGGPPSCDEMAEHALAALDRLVEATSNTLRLGGCGHWTTRELLEQSRFADCWPCVNEKIEQARREERERTIAEFMSEETCPNGHGISLECYGCMADRMVRAERVRVLEEVQHLTQRQIHLLLSEARGG